MGLKVIRTKTPLKHFRNILDHNRIRREMTNKSHEGGKEIISIVISFISFSHGAEALTWWAGYKHQRSQEVKIKVLDLTVKKLWILTKFTDVAVNPLCSNVSLIRFKGWRIDVYSRNNLEPHVTLACNRETIAHTSASTEEIHAIGNLGNG